MSFRDSGVWVQCLEMNFDFSKFLLQGRSNLGNEVFCHFFSFTIWMENMVLQLAISLIHKKVFFKLQKSGK